MPVACAARPPVADPAPLPTGAALYAVHCVECHGMVGAGDGPYAARLPVVPPDLRTITARRGGRYPVDEVRRIIDGRKPVAGHGGAGMPVWGDAFLDPADGYDARSVDEKVARLARYLQSLQAVSASR